MDKYYRTDGTNSYVVLDKHDVSIDCFDMKVLQNVKIDSLLEFEFRGLNGDRMLYYRINNLKQICEIRSGGIDYEILKNMLNQLIILIDTLRQYMLRPENLVMDTDVIYADIRKNSSNKNNMEQDHEESGLRPDGSCVGDKESSHLRWVPPYHNMEQDHEESGLRPDGSCVGDKESSHLRWVPPYHNMEQDHEESGLRPDGSCVGDKESSHLRRVPPYHNMAIMFKFIYMPDYEQPVNEQFGHLVEQLLKLVDHKDKRAVDIIYDIYDITSEPEYGIDAVASYLDSQREVFQNFDACAGDRKSSHLQQVFPYYNMEQDHEESGFRLNGPCAGDKESSCMSEEFDIVFNKDNHAMDEEDKKPVFNIRTLLLVGIIITGLTGIFFAVVQLGQNGHIEYVKPLMAVVILMAILCFIYLQITKTGQAAEPDMATVPVTTSVNMEQDHENPDIVRMRPCVGDKESSHPRWVPPYHNMEQGHEESGICMETAVLKYDDVSYSHTDKILFITDMSGNSVAEITVEDVPYILGRDVSRAPSITKNPGISRKHARILLNDKNYYIEDMNSTNGTFVNDCEVIPGHPVLLSDEDILQLGDAAFTIHI